MIFINDKFQRSFQDENLSFYILINTILMYMKFLKRKLKKGTKSTHSFHNQNKTIILSFKNSCPIYTFYKKKRY